MTRFREDAVRATRQKSADRAKKLSARGRRKSKPASCDAEFFTRRARDTADLIRLRLEKGYRRFGDRKLSGHYVGPKHEMGLRSETLDSMAAELFPALVPSAKKLRTSWGKTELERLGTKLFSLDEPYIEGNREFLGFIRIDTDRVWRSTGECRSYYENLVADGRIACAPHFLVGLRLRDGSFVRPHAIWILPYGQAVWNSPGHPQWRSEPVDLFKGVYYGLCDSLLEAGADPAAPATSQQTKNPLSPEWLTICMQDTHFPTLTEHAEYLVMTSRRENLIRRAADVQTGLEVSQSNLLFNRLQRAAYDILRAWHRNSDDDYLEAIQSDNRGRLEDNLYVALEQSADRMELRDLELKEGALEKMIAKVAEYAASSWDPKKADRKGSSTRGTLRHVVEGMKSVKERRQTAAAYATSRKTERSLESMLAAVRRLKADGKAITKCAVARESGVSRPTVIARWTDLELALSASEQGCKVRCVDKKHPQSSGLDESQIIPETAASETVPVASPIHLEENPESGKVVNLESDRKTDTYLAETVSPDTDYPADDNADRDDDWNEIEQQEAWLEIADSDPFVGGIDPDDQIGMPVEPSETGRTATRSVFCTSDTGKRKDAAEWGVFPIKRRSRDSVVQLCQSGGQRDSHFGGCRDQEFRRWVEIEGVRARLRSLTRSRAPWG
jgi:hypothetical protein